MAQCMHLGDEAVNAGLGSGNGRAVTEVCRVAVDTAQK